MKDIKIKVKYVYPTKQQQTIIYHFLYIHKWNTHFDCFLKCFFEEFNMEKHIPHLSIVCWWNCGYYCSGHLFVNRTGFGVQ